MRSLTSLLVALVLVATLSAGGGSIAFAQTGNLPSAPTNLMAVNGDNPGEVNLTWNAVPEAAFYRVGWVAFPDYESTVADGRNWLEAFHFFDAENTGQTQWTLTRLSPGVQYFFVIGSADERFGGAQCSEWSNALTLTGAPPAEVDFTSQYPNCRAVREHHPGGVKRGSPIYRASLDPDGDGTACETADTGPTPATGSAATDRAALIALYNATDGMNWTNNANWLSNASIGSWHGVTVDGNGRVVGLYLRKNQLTGTIPPELGNLTNLEGLYLGSNQLTGEIPLELGSLANLEWLSLKQNQVTGTIPPELGKLSNLTRLNIFGNQLTGTIPPELVKLSNLTFLDLQGNQLVGAIPPELGNLAGLEKLYLTFGASLRRF